MTDRFYTTKVFSAFLTTPLISKLLTIECLSKLTGTEMEPLQAVFLSLLCRVKKCSSSADQGLSTDNHCSWHVFFHPVPTSPYSDHPFC